MRHRSSVSLDMNKSRVRKDASQIANARRAGKLSGESRPALPSGDAADGITDTEGPFLAPFTMCQADPQVLWTGSRRPWRTTNGAETSR